MLLKGTDGCGKGLITMTDYGDGNIGGARAVMTP
jgi:hypothetical protein